MITDVKNSNVSRQEFIDLLCRITKTDEDMTTHTNDDNNNNNNQNEPDVTIIDNTSIVEEGEIITLDNDDVIINKKEIEDGEITESQGSDNDDDDVEELNLRLNALRSLAGAKKQKTKKFKSKRKRPNDNNRYIKDDIDLRSPNKNRSSSRYNTNQLSNNNDDREYLLDKDYRQQSVFDMLLSLISPDNNNNNSTATNITNKKLLDNYDIQQMDIVDDHPITVVPPPPLPPIPPPPPPLPPNHLPFFDPLPPLPPPPPSLFDIFTANQTFSSTNWPRPNFVQQNSIPTIQNDLWQTSFNHTTDIDLRVQPINHNHNHNHHHHSINQINEQLLHKKSQQKRKRTKKTSKKHHHERESPSPIIIINTTNQYEKIQEKLPILIENNNKNNDDDDEEERLLREELLRKLSNKRQVKIIEKTNLEPERIVTIVPSTIIQTNTNPTIPIVVNKPIEKTQYSINQRYKRVKANVSSTNLTNKIETTTTTAVRTTQPIIQTRNKIVRVPETDIEIPQSNPIIITFDDQTTDDDEQQQQQQTVKKSNESTYVIADEERQAIKRLQQLQEDVIRRTNTIESTTKTIVQKNQTSPPNDIIQEAIPSTDELSALLDKRRMLLSDRSKYGEIQEKMKKKKLENGLLARDIERLEEQLLTKKTQITNNNALLQYWQKEAMSIAQNIRQQEDLILQSAVFKSVKPISSSVSKSRTTIEFDYDNISKVFEENSTQILLSILICPLNFYRKLRPYHIWLNTISKKIQELSKEDNSSLLLRTRSFSTQNTEQYWKTCLQSYFIDINHILCPYELQGSCKAQNCIYQHQHQISNRIEQFLSSKKFNEKNKQKILNQIDSICSLQSFDVDLSIFEKRINEKQYQRCRMKLDRYLSIYHEDFRYFRDKSTNDSLSIIHPILVSVSNELDSDDFSPEQAVADLVEGLESQRTNAQLWCLYLEFSSWHMSHDELHHLCSAAIKNAQSYDLFWTIFYLCTNNIEELLSIYLTYIQSDEFDFHNRSYAICELAMFHANVSLNSDQAYEKIQNYLSNSFLENEHRIYLILVLLYIFVFGSFPRILYQQMDENRFDKQIYFEPFICPWYALSNYSHSQDEIDKFFDNFINPMDLSETNFALYINRIHYLNATKRFDQSKLYIETLLEEFPCSIELWIELLLNPEISNNPTEILERARKTTGIYFEFLYSLSSVINIQSMLNNELIQTKTYREKFFYDLCHLSLDSNIQLKQKKIEQNLIRYNGELRDITILDILNHISDFSIDIQRKMILKILNYLITNDNDDDDDDQQRILILYSFFRISQIGRVFDIIIDCLHLIHNDQYEWIIKPFTYRLLDISIKKDRNTLIWIRFDAFAKQLIYNTHCQEIYVTILQRVITSMEDKNKIARLCRLFEKQFSNCGIISQQLRQIIFNSTINDTGATITS
ncbi:unnamed protein product [Rotaria sordida]|uniref:Zinc-finger domain-containing protein n=1 Tax=Rotaria sordida TaxID=392033 RepID=A0A819AN33_9BILA|nr:unnamed protein product [Rotaria sordida]CAF3787440.1 unnamed protein product [Rotaria sordida]